MTFTPITSRPFQSEADFWSVRQLLIDTYGITGPYFNWEIRRWDGQRFHGDDAILNPDWVKLIRLWETVDGRLVGVAHAESHAGNAHFEIHPDYRSRVEDELIDWAVGNLWTLNEAGKRQLETFAYDYDVPRQTLLEKHGFERTPYFGVTRHMHLGSQPLPPVSMAEGYTLRETRSEQADYERMAALLNAAFNRSIHTAREYENFVLHSPSFRHDLNLVAEAPDGSFAAHVGITIEPTNCYALYEPVCTHPDHRRNGLGQALMFEGLHRLKRLNIRHVYVETGDMIPANALYSSIGFTEAYRGYYWQWRG
jgi:mycothiol synthase